MDAPIQQSQTPGLFTRGAAALSTLATAQFKGERVELHPSQALLAQNAAEEMGFVRSEKRQLRLAERRFTNQRSNKINAGSFLQAFGDVHESEVSSFAKTLFINQPSNSASLFNLLKRNKFEDIEQQYGALWYAYQEFLKKKKHLNKKERRFLKLLGETLESLSNEEGEKIRSSINIANVTQERAFQQLEGRSLRQAYHDSVLDYGGIAQTFKELVNKHGAAELDTYIDFLLKALAADLAAVDPSINKSQLKAIVTDLYALQSIYGVKDESDTLAGNYNRTFLPTTLLAGHAIMAEIMQFIENKWLNSSLINASMKNLDITELEQQRFFLTGLCSLSRDIPIKAFKESFQRDAIIDNIQNTLDALIDQEEQAEDNDTENNNKQRYELNKKQDSLYSTNPHEPLMNNRHKS